MQLLSHRTCLMVQVVRKNQNLKTADFLSIRRKKLSLFLIFHKAFFSLVVIWKIKFFFFIVFGPLTKFFLTFVQDFFIQQKKSRTKHNVTDAARKVFSLWLKGNFFLERKSSSRKKKDYFRKSAPTGNIFKFLKMRSFSSANIWNLKKPSSEKTNTCFEWELWETRKKLYFTDTKRWKSFFFFWESIFDSITTLVKK